MTSFVHRLTSRARGLEPGARLRRPSRWEGLRETRAAGQRSYDPVAPPAPGHRTPDGGGDEAVLEASADEAEREVAGTPAEAVTRRPDGPRAPEPRRRDPDALRPAVPPLDRPDARRAHAERAAEDPAPDGRAPVRAAAADPGTAARPSQPAGAAPGTGPDLAGGEPGDTARRHAPGHHRPAGVDSAGSPGTTRAAGRPAAPGQPPAAPERPPRAVAPAARPVRAVPAPLPDRSGAVTRPADDDGGAPPVDADALVRDRLVPALVDAGVLARGEPVALGPGAQPVRGARVVVGRTAAARTSAARDGPSVHVHIERVEVRPAAPPAPQPAAAPGQGVVDHEAYLARRREPW